MWEMKQRIKMMEDDYSEIGKMIGGTNLGVEIRNSVFEHIEFDISTGQTFEEAPTREYIPLRATRTH